MKTAILKLPNAKVVRLPLQMRIGSNSVGRTWQLRIIDKLCKPLAPEWCDIEYVFAKTPEQALRSAFQFLMLKGIEPVIKDIPAL